MENRRIFLIVLDSYGIGALPDAADFGDEGSNTLKTITTSKAYDTPNMKKLGLFNIDGVDWMKNGRESCWSVWKDERALSGKTIRRSDTGRLPELYLQNHFRYIRMDFQKRF